MATPISLPVEGLNPNENYIVQVFATRAVNGVTHISTYSTPLGISTPSFSASGTNVSTVNSGTDTQLSGGSIFAGSFPAGVGQINVATGTVNGTGVILNSTGLAGFSNGTKEFYIDASTGKAYFAGNLTAGTIKIGPLVDPTNTKSGIYINSKNYWYDDGSFSATSIDVAGTLLNTTDPTSIPKPNAVTNLQSSWVGTTLNVTWDWTAGSPDFSKDFILSFTEGSTTKSVIVPISSRSYSLSLTENKAMFGFVSTVISLSIVAEDRFGNKSTATTAAGATYISALSAPLITVTSVKNGYSVAWNNQTDPSFDAISIEEVESTAGADPGIGYNVVYSGNLNPAIVITPNTNDRWVRARFVDTIGGFTSYSTAYHVTPTSPVTVNVTAPTEVTIGTVSWSGSNIVVPYTLPSSNAGIRFLIKLTPTLNTSVTGYFYFFTDGTLNLNQSYTITSSDLFAQFGAYYSSYSGTFISYSSTDVPTAGVSFSVPIKTTTLTSVTPTPTTIANTNGYVSTFDFSSVPANYAEVYQKYTSNAWPSTSADQATMSYVSGGSSGTNTIVINNLRDNDGNILTTFPEGYLITGLNIPTNTFVSSVSGSSPTFTLTLSTYNSATSSVVASNFTGQASGVYTVTGLVYSGPSPANIFSNFYAPTSVVVRYYDNFGNGSLLSNPTIVTPINPSLSVITNATQIGSDGSIYVGGSSTTGARIVLGPSQKAPDGSQYAGIFAFDYGSTSGSAASTSIITNPSASGYTFETINAKIADWTISTNKIESTLVSGITKYTGLSASNTNYAFWAGATSAGNSDNSAPFSVTPLGAVQASNITISGGQLDVGATSSNLSSGFHVTSNGIMYATGAIVNGTITATGGSFSGNVSIASGITGGASIYSGTLNSSGSLTSAGFILNSTGLTFSNSTTQGITTIDATSGLFTTKSANIGGWTVGNPNITATSGSGTITLDSTNARISANTTSGGNYYVGLAAPTSSSSVVFWAGNAGLASSSNAFVVLADGTVQIGGTNASNFITSSQVNSNVTSISGGVITSGTINLSNGATIGTGGSYPITINSGGISSTNFSISSNNGNASFTGTINATQATLGNWQLSSGVLASGGTYLYGNSASNSQGILTDKLISAKAYQFYTGIATLYGNSSGWTSNGNVYPGDGVSGNGQDASFNLGSSSFRWNYIYSAHSLQLTSDLRTKNDIQPAVLGLNFINALKPVSFKMNQGTVKEIKNEDGTVKFETIPGKRRHYGFIAQDVYTAVKSLGLDPSLDFAGWTLDDPSDSDSRQGLVYDYFVSPLVSAVQELSNKIDILQSELDSLKK